MSTRYVTVRQLGERFPRAGRGHVFSAHERALNLALDGAPCLATLVTDPGLMTVSSALILPREGAFDLSGFARGDAVTVLPERVLLGSGSTLWLEGSGAEVFTGRIAAAGGHGAGNPGGSTSLDGAGGGGPRPNVRAAAIEVLRAIPGARAAGGFAPLAAGLLAGLGDQADRMPDAAYSGSDLPAGLLADLPTNLPTELPGADPFAREAWRTVRTVLVAAANAAGARAEGRGQRNAPGTLGGLAGLVGLGIGFTPSGDDLVVGFLAAQALLAGDESADAGRGRALLVERAASTTLPGATIVRQAAEDRFPAYLCRFAEEFAVALIRPAARRIGEATAQAASHGHSSGTDALVGFAVGALLALLKT